MICNKCGEDKPPSEFYADKKRKSGINTICKECIIKQVHERYIRKSDEKKEYSRLYYEKHKDNKRKSDTDYHIKVSSLKTPCVKCGDDRLYVLDFHHVEPSEKTFNIYRKSAKSNFALIEEEISKCVCLCRNCHSEFHHFYGQVPQNGRECLEEYLGRKVDL